MIEKLALRRQKPTETEEPAEETITEEKPAKMQVESVVVATSPRDIETQQKNVEEIHKAADAEAMAQEIKLPHKKKRPAPSYPDQSQRRQKNRQQRMTSQQVAEARQATAAALSHEVREEKPTVVMKEEHEQFDTTKLDISKIVGFNDELDRQFRMVDDLSKKSSEKEGGEDR